MPPSSVLSWDRGPTGTPCSTPYPCLRNSACRPRAAWFQPTGRPSLLMEYASSARRLGTEVIIAGAGGRRPSARHDRRRDRARSSACPFGRPRLRDGLAALDHPDAQRRPRRHARDRPAGRANAAARRLHRQQGRRRLGARRPAIGSRNSAPPRRSACSTTQTRPVLPMPDSTPQPGSGDRVVAILGAGQLGRMLALRSSPRVRFRFSTPSPTPRRAVGELIQAPTTTGPRSRAYRRHGSGHFRASRTSRLACSNYRRAGPRPRRPTARPARRRARDRTGPARRENALPPPEHPHTPRFAKVGSREDLEAAISELGAPLVVKTRRGGYDGKGRSVARDANQAGDCWLLGPPPRGRPDRRGVRPVVREALDHRHALAPARSAATRSSRTARRGILQPQRRARTGHRCGPADQSRDACPATDGALDYVGTIALELFEVKDSGEGWIIANEPRHASTTAGTGPSRAAGRASSRTTSGPSSACHSGRRYEARRRSCGHAQPRRAAPSSEQIRHRPTPTRTCTAEAGSAKSAYHAARSRRGDRDPPRIARAGRRARCGLSPLVATRAGRSVESSRARTRRRTARHARAAGTLVDEHSGARRTRRRSVGARRAARRTRVRPSRTAR